MTREPGFLPGQRLWTPWRMAYVGGGEPSPDCVFCSALEGDDDAGSLIVHRGLHAFVILNLFPYNTGHLLVVPNSHTRDLAALSSDARAEMAELTASFCTGLQLVMGCDGFNTGMNLGSAAGAGIADHVHQHIVPRWIGDANFMPIVGGTKVLPELIPATYAKIRAEVDRQKSGATIATAMLFAPDGSGLYLAGIEFPAILLEDGASVWKPVMTALGPEAASCELLGWAGGASTTSDPLEPPCLALSFSARSTGAQPHYRLVPFEHARAVMPDAHLARVREAAARLGLDASGL